MALDDLELDRDGVSAPPPPGPAPPGVPASWRIAGALVLAVIAGGVARWWTLDRGAPGESAAPSPVAGTEVTLPSEAALPPLDQMDPFLRTLLGALSTRPELARWLATDRLIDQMASAIDRLSRGDSPAPDLGVLAPDTEFTVVGTRGRIRQVDEASFRRYDSLADLVAGLDPAAVAAAYRTIRPRLHEAYRRLGRSESDVDVAVRRALEVLVSTPLPEGPIRVVEGRGATWAYGDPALEALDPAQKHLLRMGPRNAARVIDTLKRVQQQLQP